MGDVGYGGCKPRIKGNDNFFFFFFFFWGGGGVWSRGGGGGSCWGGQGGWERRIEAFVKIQKKIIFFWEGGGGVGLGVRVDVNGEVKFLSKIQKKMKGGSCWGGQGGWERRIEAFVKIQKIFFFFFFFGGGGVGLGVRVDVNGEVKFL